MKNNNHFYQNLQYRLSTFMSLSSNETLHAYLLPELFLQTLRDTYRYVNHCRSNQNALQIADSLCIPYSEEEKSLLKNIEHSLRKPEDYLTLTQTYNLSILISLAQKLQEFVHTIMES